MDKVKHFSKPHSWQVTALGFQPTRAGPGPRALTTSRQCSLRRSPPSQNVSPNTGRGVRPGSKQALGLPSRQKPTSALEERHYICGYPAGNALETKQMASQASPIFTMTAGTVCRPFVTL